MASPLQPVVPTLQQPRPRRTSVNPGQLPYDAHPPPQQGPSFQPPPQHSLTLSPTNEAYVSTPAVPAPHITRPSPHSSAPSESQATHLGFGPVRTIYMRAPTPSQASGKPKADPTRATVEPTHGRPTDNTQLKQSVEPPGHKATKSSNARRILSQSGPSSADGGTSNGVKRKTASDTMPVLEGLPPLMIRRPETEDRHRRHRPEPDPSIPYGKNLEELRQVRNELITAMRKTLGEMEKMPKSHTAPMISALQILNYQIQTFGRAVDAGLTAWTHVVLPAAGRKALLDMDNLAKLMFRQCDAMLSQCMEEMKNEVSISVQ